jgi:lipopolysaccharide transport system permease protein
VLSGFLPWTLFSVSVGAGISSLTSQANLITKTYFPREILPLSSLAASALDFVITFLLLAALMVYSQVEISWNILFAIPILAIEILLTIGIMLILSLINVWYRDISHFAGLMLQLWMYLTPVVYPLSMVPENYRSFMWLNPMVGIVEGFRAAVVEAESPDAGMLLISFVISFLVFVGGYGLFKTHEFRLADTI